MLLCVTPLANTFFNVFLFYKMLFIHKLIHQSARNPAVALADPWWWRNSDEDNVGVGLITEQLTLPIDKAILYLCCCLANWLVSVTNFSCLETWQHLYNTCLTLFLFPLSHPFYSFLSLQLLFLSFSPAIAPSVPICQQLSVSLLVVVAVAAAYWGRMVWSMFITSTSLWHPHS